MSYLNKSRHIYMSHVIDKCGRSYMKSHITYTWVKCAELSADSLAVIHVTGVMSHMNESCHIWMSHVTYEWVMSHMNESCHIWMRHATYHVYVYVYVTEVMSHMNVTSRHIHIVTWRLEPKSCHICMSHVTWVMSHAVTYVCDRSHVTYECVMSHMNESCHICMSHVTCSNCERQVLQCATVGCSVLQCVAVCCSVLQCVVKCTWQVLRRNIGRCLNRNTAQHMPHSYAWHEPFKCTTWVN